MCTLLSNLSVYVCVVFGMFTYLQVYFRLQHSMINPSLIMLGFIITSIGTMQVITTKLESYNFVTYLLMPEVEADAHVRSVIYFTCTYIHSNLPRTSTEEFKHLQVHYSIHTIIRNTSSYNILIALQQALVELYAVFKLSRTALLQHISDMTQYRSHSRLPTTYIYRYR